MKLSHQMTKGHKLGEKLKSGHPAVYKKPKKTKMPSK